MAMILLLSSSRAWSAPDAPVSTSIERHSGVAPRPQKSSLRFETWGQNYLGVGKNFFRSDQVPEQNAVIQVQSQDRKSWSGGELRWNVSGLWSVSEQQFYPNLNEAFFERTGSSGEWSVGRRRQNWSRGENLWRRGLWEPQFEWDKMWAQSQGLTGIHWQQSAGAWHFKAFASPFFVPGIGPQLENRNGQMLSANPWFRPPIESIEFLGSQTDVRYRLNMPTISDILLQPGLALETHYDSSLGSLSVAYAFKPMNQLFLAGPFFLRPPSSLGSDPSLDVEVNPSVQYHHLAQIEMVAHVTNRWESLFAITQEWPQLERQSPTWLDQNAEPATVLDVAQMFALGIGDRVKGFVAYTQVWGGDVGSKNEMAGGALLFERRYRYLQAARLGAQSSWSMGRGDMLKGLFEATYDWAQNAAHWAVEARYQASGAWEIFSRLDILGLVSSSSPRVRDGFLADYRANDRVEVGVSYAF